VLVGAFCAEVVLLTGALLLTWPQSVPAVAMLAFWVLQQVLLRPRGDTMRQKLEGYDHAPLAEYYFLLFPVGLASARGLSSPSFLLISAMFLSLGWCYVGMMTGEWRERWKARAHSA
jgi:hypothetical protein